MCWASIILFHIECRTIQNYSQMCRLSLMFTSVGVHIGCFHMCVLDIYMCTCCASIISTMCQAQNQSKLFSNQIKKF